MSASAPVRVGGSEGSFSKAIHANELLECSLQKQEYSIDILNALKAAKDKGALGKWGATAVPERVNVFQGELRKVGVKNTGAIATPTVRNERAFLIAVVGVTSVLAVAGQFLPGDWVRGNYPFPGPLQLG